MTSKPPGDLLPLRDRRLVEPRAAPLEECFVEELHGIAPRPEIVLRSTHPTVHGRNHLASSAANRTGSPRHRPPPRAVINPDQAVSVIISSLTLDRTELETPFFRVNALCLL